MICFRVDDMTCAHCVNAIVKSIAEVDERARVGVDMAERLVMVDSSHPAAETLRAAIAKAGYAAVPVDASNRLSSL
jgi:copper chaperone